MKEVDNLPTILIISDGAPCKTKNGVSQTLYNLFDGYPSDKLFFLKDEFNSIANDKDELSGKIIRVRLNYIPVLHNRIGSSGGNFVIEKVNSFLRDRLPFPTLAKNQVKPDVILLAATSVRKLQIARRWSVKYKIALIPYFLDDWTAPIKMAWITNHLQGLVRDILTSSSHWMVISEQLKHILEERFNYKPVSTLVIHNPVDASESISQYIIKENESLEIVYAGSIFPMHLDAILLTARAIKLLNNRQSSKQYKLKIYTKDFFWTRYEEQFKEWEVVYGGYVHPDDLDAKMKTAWLILIPASFLSEWAHMSKSSLQTKTTESMKTGVPILSVGPSYGACNLFFKQWNAAFIYDDNKVEGLAIFLGNECSDSKLREAFSESALNAIKNHFNKKVIQNKLYNFLFEFMEMRKI